MSERFSDEVLQRAFLKTYAAWDRTTPASLLDALAAMRAVLEGHLAERFTAARQLGDWPEHCEQRAFVDGAKWWEFRKTGGTMWAQDVSIAEYVAVERYGEPGAASDGTGQPAQNTKALCRCGCTFEQHDDPTQFRPAISTGAAS